MPESARGYAILLATLCDAISHSWVTPLKQRPDCAEAIKQIVTEVQSADAKALSEMVVRRVRNDNDAVFRSRQWESTLRGLGVEPAHSVP